MKYLTKENILLVLVSLLVLGRVSDMRKSRRGSERVREVLQQRMRGMERTDWGSRMEGMRKAREGTAKQVVSVDKSCCDKTD